MKSGIDASPGPGSSQGFLRVAFHHCVGARSSPVWTPPDWSPKRTDVPTTPNVVFPGMKGDADGESRTPLTLCLSLKTFHEGCGRRTSCGTKKE